MGQSWVYISFYFKFDRKINIFVIIVNRISLKTSIYTQADTVSLSWNLKENTRQLQMAGWICNPLLFSTGLCELFLLPKGLKSSNLTIISRKHTTLLKFNTDMFRHLHMPSSVWRECKKLQYLSINWYNSYRNDTIVRLQRKF